MTTKLTNDHYHWHGRFGIPVESNAAFDFYLRRLLVPRSRIEMMLAPAARRSSMLGRLIFPSEDSRKTKIQGFNNQSNVASTTQDTISLAPEIAKRLKSAGINVEGDIDLLMLVDYSHSARDQSVLFIFDRIAKTPVAIVKVGAAALHRKSLEREFQTLQNLTKTLSSHLVRTIPQPIELFVESEQMVLMETVLPGSSIHFKARNSWIPARSTDGYFKMALGWLANFHQATYTRKVKFGHLRVSEIADHFREYRTYCNASKEEENFMSDLMIKSAAFDEEEIPLSAVQGDFWTRNVIVNGKEIGVVDWEAFEAEGNSLDDAFMFVISYGRGYPWRLGCWLEPHEAFKRTFYEESWLTEIVAKHLTQFCLKIGVTNKLLGILMAAFLARMAVKEALISRDRHFSHSEAGNKSSVQEKEVAVWQSLFREYAAARKNVCFG
jgi:hypothetical protein